MGNEEHLEAKDFVVVMKSCFFYLRSPVPCPPPQSNNLLCQYFQVSQEKNRQGKANFGNVACSGNSAEILKDSEQFVLRGVL